MSDDEGTQDTRRSSLKSTSSILLGTSSYLYQNPSRMSADHPPHSALCLDVSSDLGVSIQGLEVAIKNPKKKYQDKVSALLSGWERLASLSNAPPAAVNNLAECLYRDTLTLVLKGHWPKLSPATKTHLSVTLQRCVGSLICPSALKKCRDLIGLVNNPWGNPTLTGIFNNPEGIDDAEVLEFCLSEKESMLFMRLDTLCDSKCEDLALKLARACLRCLRLPDTRFHDVCTQDELNYILDLYIFLLYKFKNVQEIINELKHLDLKEGLELIRRYSATKNVNIPPRIWKNSQKVAELAAQYFLAVAMVKPVNETVGLLKDLMTEWAILHCRDEVISENLANMIRKLIQPAESALHVYIFIEVLVDKFGYSLKSLCIELYIRGLTMDMNELEHQKVVGDEEKVKETEVRLSYGFQKLADLLKDNVGVSRECILTAFSLYPTDSSYKQIREMAVASGKIKNCSPQLILRKRKTKIPFRAREERLCKSVYRRKVARVIENDSSSHSPATLNRSLKKCYAELLSGTSEIQNFRRTINQKPCPSELKSPIIRRQSGSEYSEQNQLGKDDRVSLNVTNCEGLTMVSRLTSQTDMSSSSSISNTHRCNACKGDDLIFAGDGASQKDMSLLVDVVNPNLRSRSGSLNLAETDTCADISSPVDVDTNKRSRSRCVDEGVDVPSCVENGRARCRSAETVSSHSCNTVTPVACRLRKRPIPAPKCLCGSCLEGTKKLDHSRPRRNSVSVELIKTNEPSRVKISTSDGSQRSKVLRRTKSELSLSPCKYYNARKVLRNCLFCKPSVYPNSLSFNDSVKCENTGRRPRSHSRQGNSASNQGVSKDPKLRRAKSCSRIHDGSKYGTLYKSISWGGYGSDYNHKVEHMTHEKHHERCTVCEINVDDYTLPLVNIEKLPVSYREKFQSTASESELTCKVCGNLHQESTSRANNPSLFLGIQSISPHKKDPKSMEFVTSINDSHVKTSLNYDVLSAPNEVLDAEKLGLTSQLCDDLAVVLSSPRWHMLSWVLDWSQLSSLCERYLRDREGMRNVTKELKYLNIDYNQFKDRPSAIDNKDEYCGIEKGYEQWVDVSSDHSDQDFMYSSAYKKSGSMQSHEDTDSDSSVLSQRQKCNVHSPDSSQSELDFNVKKIKKKPFRTLSISDSDTGTQDSRAESLGSDGCYKERPKRKVPECKRKKIPLVKRIAEKRLHDLSKIRLIVEEDIRKNSHDSRELSGNAKEVMTIFSQIDEGGKKSTSKPFSHGSYSSPPVNPILPPVTKKDKDSKTLKSLRMFRPNHLKSVRDRIFSPLSEPSKLKPKSNDEGIKFAPMLSTLNLNPRILLTRADVSSHYLKSKNVTPVIVKNTALNAQQGTKSNGMNAKTSQCLGEKKNIFSTSRKGTFSKSHKRVLKKLDVLRPDFELITQAVIESQLLARTVPGLNSLDMMVPPPSEPTVQVIQLPHNPPSSTSGNHGSTTVSTPQKVTATQGVQTSNSTPQKVTTTQGVQTSPISSSQKSTVTQGVQISPGLNQAPVGGEPGPSTISHHPDEHWQTPHLSVSATDVSHNVPAFSSSSSQGEQTFAGVLMETRYFSPSNVPGNVNTGTPVTAHIQRVGQPPVGLDVDGTSSLRRLHQCPPQLLSGTHIPIVKGVSLDIVANLRAEALRNADLAESFSSNLGTPRGLQISGSLDAQKVHIVTKKDGKTYNLTPVSSTQTSPETKVKQTRIQKVDEDSQTDSVVHGAVLTATEECSGQTFLLMEDGVSKFVGPGKKQHCVKVMKSSSSQVATLPKFQQAFGKTIYASNSPGAIEPTNRAQNTAIEERVSTGCINPATTVATEKLESMSGPGSVLSKGIQTTSIGGSSPSKACVNIQPPNNSLSDTVKSTSSEDVLTRSVPVLCAVQSVSSVATQSETPSVSSCSLSTSNFVNSPATTGSAVSHNAVLSEASSVAHKIPVVTSSQVIGTLCEVHQTSQQQQHPITIPMKLSMVSLTSNLSEKELSLRSKMTELLNRALQRNVTSTSMTSTNISTNFSIKNLTGVVQEKNQEAYASSSDDTGSESIESVNDQEESRITNSENVRCIIQTPRVTRPLIEVAVEENTVSPVGNHAAALHGALRPQHSVTGHVPSVLCSASSDTSVVTAQVSQSVDAANSLISHNTIHPTVSSTTLEQLREFESVLEQVTNTSQMKERKSVLPQTESETANDLTQQLLLSQTSTPTNSTDFDSSNTPSTSFSRESFPSSPPTTSPKGGSTSFANQATTIHTSASSARISSTTPVVVVTSYSQPIASPSLSVTSQSSSSPNVTPASTPGKTPPKSSPKNSKSKSMKTTPTTTSKTTPVTKPQQKPQEDEETAQRIYAILDQYAEQLKNSPDLINKPAPRRRSNPPINPIGSSKRKKSTPTKLRLSGHPPVLTESSPGADDPRTAGSEDSSSGITQLPQVHDSPVTIPSNSDDTLRSTPTHESPPTFQLRRASNVESCESREINRASRPSSDTQAAPTDSSSQESPAVGALPVATPTPSSSGTVVAGKSLVVGSATALPLYVPGGVRQVLFPVASGLTASMQGRPVVVTKGSKVIRVHQVTVAGGSPMLAGAVAGAKPLQVTTGATAVQGALVVRQMCVNKAAVSTPSVPASQVSPLTMVGTANAVKQLKLPVMQAVAGGISSQTIAGVTAQPPVVLPPGSHPLTGASILPPNFSCLQGAPSSEDSKEAVGTPMHEENSIVSTSIDLLQSNPSSSQEQTVDSAVTSTVPLTHSKPEGAGEVSSLSSCECVSAKGSSGVKTSSVGCETEPHPEAGQPALARSIVSSHSAVGCVNTSQNEEPKKIVTNISLVNKYEIKSYEDNIRVDTSVDSSSEQTVVDAGGINSRNVINPNFQESVLVDTVPGKVSQRNVKNDSLSVLQCIDAANPGKGGMIGVVSNTYLENDTGSRSNTEQNLLVGSSVIQSGSSNGSESIPEVISSLPPSANCVPGSMMDSSRRVPNNQCSITSSAGPPCTSFLPKDSHDRLHAQQTPTSPAGYRRDEKKAERPLEEHIPNDPLPRDKSDGVTASVKELLSTPQPKSIDEPTSLEGSSIDGGKSLVLGAVSEPSKTPKTLVTGVDDLTKVISPEVKSCEERSSEDEMEKRLSRTLTIASSSDYCYPLKRSQGDSKTPESPWRYVPVVKRVSVSQGKAVPVDSALMRAHVESEACISLPRITDPLPDELKGGESDDGCRSNFTTSIGTPHGAVKRRLFSDEVLEYSSYPSSKKTDKVKQRVEKLTRVPDAIEREFRQTRLELEKELRLQKSLSEECEDLGVDEPSTSDLFPEADLLLDPNPSPSYDQTMPDTSCAQNVDSSEPFSSSDFRSVDSSSSAEGVHDSAGCSKTLNISGSKTMQRKEKPSPARPRKYLLRHRGEKKKWVSVRNHHGSLEYRKASKDDDKRQALLQRPPRISTGDVGAGSLNGSKTVTQTNVALSTFTSSSGEDSLSQHPIEGTTHTSTPTFSSDVTYSPQHDDTIQSPNSQTSQTMEISNTPTAAQKFNITYGKKGQSYSKEYCRRGSKRSRVCRFVNYLCEQGDSRDTCDSWDSSNSVEKESTSESSKCGRSYHGMKDLGSPSTSPEEDDDGKSIPEYQETTPNHTTFSNLLPINSLKLSKENMDQSVLEGMEDDNAILPSANGLECDDVICTQKKNVIGKSSLRKHVIEKNAKKHILDKIDLYPRVCLKKWKGKDSITCSRYALELENVSAVPTGSKHFSCVERPLLESESSVSSDPSSENSSKTSIEQSIAVGHLGLSKSLVLGKDGEFNIQSDCPNQSSVLKSSRRSSLRGHVKKGCPCCNGSPEPKKSRVFKGEKISKKVHSSKPCSKLHITKKR